MAEFTPNPHPEAVDVPADPKQLLLLMLRDMEAAGTWDARTMKRVIENVEGFVCDWPKDEQSSWTEVMGAGRYRDAAAMDRRILALAELHKVFEAYDSFGAGVGELYNALRLFLHIDRNSTKRPGYVALRDAAERAMLLIGAYTEGKGAAHREASVNEAWHVLDAALKAQGA